MNIKTSGGNFETISNARSALSSIISIDGVPFDQCHNGCRFMEGKFNNDTPRPKYDFMWDPDLLLTYIKIIANNKHYSL